MAETAANARAGSAAIAAGHLDGLRARSVWMYFVEGRTQSEIATTLGVSRVAIVRCLADARRRRNEVRITIAAPLAELAGLERALQDRFGIARVIAAPMSDPDGDPTQVIAAAAGRYIGERMRSGLTIGVGWGRMLHASLAFIAGRTLEDFRVVWLLGGIAAAGRVNPAEFGWQFAELFQGEGYPVPAPALVDSPETKHALLERCGLAEIFDLVDGLDIALLSVGGIETATTSHRMGHISEPERRALIEAGTVGDTLCNFVDARGRTVDHQVNARAIAVDLDRLRRTPERVIVSGGREKLQILDGAIARLAPTVLVTDEVTAAALLDGRPGGAPDRP